MKFKYLIILSLVFSISCDKKNTLDKTIFIKKSESNTGINFANNLVENDSLNYFTYGYMYMGGGVSAGDVNNDGLIDLYFTGNMVSNKLYLNKGNMTFEDVSEKAGVSGDSRWYTGVTMIDINNDGFLDIYCSVSGKFGSKKNQLFINNQDETYSEVAESYGIADIGNSVQSVFFDYDLDGDLDLYVANYPPTSFNAPNSYYYFKKQNVKAAESDKLYRNDGTTFTDVTEQAGLNSFGLSLSATVGDVNQDGWPDLYVSNDFSTPDLFYINNKNGTFTERVKELTKNTSFYGMGVDIADINNDMLLDIFQVDMTAQNNRRAKANMASMDPALFWSTVNSGFHYQYMQNSLQINNGLINDSLPDFSNVSRLSGISSTDWSWGPLIVDLDNDGLKDIFIANGTRREINNKDYFGELEKTRSKNDSPLEKSLGIPSERIDNFVFKNTGDLNFEKANEEWGISFKGFSNGSVYADLDNDGDLEIITNNIDDTASVFENTSSTINNSVSIELNGPQKNPLGIGTKVFLKTKNSTQFQELTLTRGFQSSVAPRIHFGLGDIDIIETLTIEWPDRKIQTISNLSVNQMVTFNHSDAKEKKQEIVLNTKKLFTTENDSTKIIKHLHVENQYNDFIDEILLPHQTSRLGPFVSVGDLNGDSLDDLIVGGSMNTPTALYIQQENGFIPIHSEDIENDLIYEDMGSVLFDADNDGDNDLYMISGGNEFDSNSELLQDRFYINDGSGNFTKAVNALPKMIESGSVVKPYDFDNDGDLDLFVGGRLIPKNYPAPANSYILENQSTSNQIKFVDITQQFAPSLKKSGMVTDALWTDHNNDGKIDLILVGEWMPITILTNENGSLVNETEAFNLNDSNGWWFSLNEGDFDNDGDMDYIVGNLGMNFKYKANKEETFDIFFNDFDGNNTNDIVLSYFNGGKQYPLRGRECSSQQMPAIKQKFKDYGSFANATLEDVYTDEYLENSLHYSVASFSSIFLENKNGRFEKHELPNLAQLSNINQIIVEDYNEDGNLDFVVAGNLYSSEVETPRNDASIGLYLQGDGSGAFTALPSRESGLFIPGDVKDLAQIIIKGQQYLIASKNSAYLQFIKVN